MKYKKIIIIGIIVLTVGLIISALSNSTYALFSNDDYGTNNEVYTTGILAIEATSKSENISLDNALPMTDKEGKESTPYVFNIKNVGNLDYRFDIKLLSTGNSSTSIQSKYIKVQVDDGEVSTLADLNSIIKSGVTLLAGESMDISIRVWLDINTSNTELGKSFNSKIVTDGEAIYTSTNNGVNLVTMIKYLYNSASKTTATNNGITYNYASSVSLMNDRLGTMSVGADDGNIRYYGVTPNNYIDIGDVYDHDIKNWVEPFIDLEIPESMIPTNEAGCKAFLECSNLVAGGFFTSESQCEAEQPNLIQQYGFTSIDEVCTVIPAGTTKALYRIIGLFKDVELSDGTKKDLVKVIRDESIGDYSWDTSASTVNSGFGINQWGESGEYTGADLMKLLNPGYDNNTDLNNSGSSITVNNSLWWNSGSGMCYSGRRNNTTSCYFSNSGLSSNVHNKIAEVKWNLGGWNESSIYPNQIYGYERGENVIQNPLDRIKRTTVWPGKVALAYPSDYGYAADLNSCNERLNLYNDSICTESNWMYNTLTMNGGNFSWLLAPYSSNANNAWNVSNGGNVNYGGNVSHIYGVSPVFYLDSVLGIESGDGSEDSPYVVR